MCATEAEQGKTIIYFKYCGESAIQVLQPALAAELPMTLWITDTLQLKM